MKSINRRKFLRNGIIGATGLALAPVAMETASAVQQDDKQDSRKTNWCENYAYTLGIQAYIFGFPYVYLPFLRWSWVTGPDSLDGVTLTAPLNHFRHIRQPVDATHRTGGFPNNDTLYSLAWIDVGREPVILSHPDMGDRYFSFQMACMESDNFAYVGNRTTGSRAGSFAIIGPNWKGSLPKGVKSLTPSRTPSALIIGRTMVNGQSDITIVNALQDQYLMAPLSLWGKKGVELPENRNVWKPFDTKDDSLAEWKTMNRAMTENLPEARLEKLLGLFSKIEIGPNRDVDKLNEFMKNGVARAAIDGRKLLVEALRSGMLGKRINGWNIPYKSLGRSGLYDDFLLRASVQCLAGIVANEPEEAVYYNTFMDESGQSLNGSKCYIMWFQSDQLPKVDGFWSITLYDPTNNFTPNSINRYAIGNRTSGLKWGNDGGLTIYIQSTSPGTNKESNWLPSTISGPFSLVMRTYLPGTEIVEQKWAPPGIKAV